MRNKLQALMARKKKLVIPAEKTTTGEPFEIDLKGLTFPELTKFAAMAEDKDYEGAINLLLYTTLRKSIPTKEKDAENGLSDDELKETIKEMDGLLASEIVSAVMETSGMKVNIPKKDLEVAGREERTQ